MCRGAGEGTRLRFSAQRPRCKLPCLNATFVPRHVLGGFCVARPSRRRTVICVCNVRAAVRLADTHHLTVTDAFPCDENFRDLLSQRPGARRLRASPPNRSAPQPHEPSGVPAEAALALLFLLRIFLAATHTSLACQTPKQHKWSGGKRPGVCSCGWSHPRVTATPPSSVSGQGRQKAQPGHNLGRPAEPSGKIPP